jgi:RNA polymerase sigma factor (sigma-70 family)
MNVSEKPQAKLKNTELVKHCANDPTNNEAWLEFISRYEKRIYNTITQECKKSELNNYCFQFIETVKDLVQDVYLKILENDCKALKKFRGDSENSIYSYLNIIAKNVVKNYITKMQAQKRPQIEKSLDDINILTEADGEAQRNNKINPGIFSTEQEVTLKILKEEIDYCLAKTLTGKDRTRNKFIYRLYLYDGLSPKEIALLFDFHISRKRIANIIYDSKRKLIKKLSIAKHHENLTC